jgi:hypothetical protein
MCRYKIVNKMHSCGITFTVFSWYLYIYIYIMYCWLQYVLYKIVIYNGGHAVAKLVEALRYKPEGREFDSRWCHWNFSLT